MSRVNLLPPEIRKRRSGLRLARRIRFFGICAVLLLGGLYGLRTFQVLSLRQDLSDVQAEQASVTAQIDALAEVAQAQSAVDASRQLISTLMRGEISWSEQLLHVATTVPPEFGLNTLSGSGTGDPSQVLVGSLTFSASSSGFSPAQAWILRLQSQEGWTNGWVGSVQGLPVTTVGGSVDLTQDALTPRGGRPA